MGFPIWAMEAAPKRVASQTCGFSRLSNPSAKDVDIQATLCRFENTKQWLFTFARGIPNDFDRHRSFVFNVTVREAKTTHRDDLRPERIGSS